MPKAFPQNRADYDRISQLARQASELLAQQTDLLKNGDLSAGKLKEYLLREDQIRILIMALNREGDEG